jgi:plastocyanin
MRHQGVVMMIRTGRSRTSAARRRTVLFGVTLLALAVLALAAASCGGDGGGGLYFDQNETTTDVSTTVAAEGAQVVMRSLAFDPGTVTITAGETVTWTNEDSTNHTVTADEGQFESGDLGSGETFSLTFNEAGSYAYHCSIHPSMKGTVVVE